MVKQYYPSSHGYNVLQHSDLDHDLPHPLYVYYKSRNHPFSKYYDVENSDHYIGVLQARNFKVKVKPKSSRKESGKVAKHLELAVKSNQGMFLLYLGF